MNPITVGDLQDQFCSKRNYDTGNGFVANPWHEEFAGRRYNFSPSLDKDSVRIVFLKDVLKDPSNKTLRRNGRFLWCKNLEYEGKDENGLRVCSFTVDKGFKRFRVSENNMLCIPSKTYVNNNRYFRTTEKTFLPFSTVFSYRNAIRLISHANGLSTSEQSLRLQQDSPYKPGTLVYPRLGYFFPGNHPAKYENTNIKKESHPCGLILGPSLLDDQLGREFYRVRFGETTYEKVHPVQMEIINEV